MVKLPTPHQLIRTGLFILLLALLTQLSPFIVQQVIAAQPFRIYDNNVFICVGNPCTATAPTSEGNFVIEGVLKMVGGNPAAGKVLMSDAVGTAVWEFLTNGWTDGGTTVYTTTDSDNVAIGTTTPAVPVDVASKVTIQTGSGQFDQGVYLLPSTHATSLRANAGFDKWSLNKDWGGAGNSDFFIWDATNSRSPLRIDVTGANWNSGSNTIELTALASGNRVSQINFHGDDTYTDYGFRIRRGDTNPPNAISSFAHRGTGAMVINAVDAGHIGFYTNSTNRIIMSNAGNVSFAAPTSGYTINAVGMSRFYRAAADMDVNSGGQIAVRSDGAGTNPYISFLKNGIWGAHFGLDDDNWFSTRGWSAGATGYTSMKVGSRFVMQATSTNLRFNDTDQNPDWHIFLGVSDLAFAYDAAGDGEWDDPGVFPLLLKTTTANARDWECADCIDQGDLKTSTGVTAGTVAVDIRMSDYSFFPNIELDNCGNWHGSDNLAAGWSNWADDYVGTFRMMRGCGSGSWKVRFRHVAASRPPEIFAWYDTEHGVLQHIWVSEVPLTALDRLPVELLEAHPTWIPVQATLFDSELAQFNQNIDADDLLNNYTFSRVAKRSDLNPEDELIKVQQQKHDECLVAAKQMDDVGVDPESKCFQFITAPDIYYGQLVRSDKTAQIKRQLESQRMAEFEANRSTYQADLAENYEGASDTEPGDIIAIDRAQNNFLVKATASESQQLAGVMSTSPGHVLGREQENNIQMALVGRVPVKMSQSSLPVRPGDMITVSQEAGKGQKAIQQGWVVGKALESWEPASGKDSVLVLLNTSVYDPQLVQRSLEGYQLAETDAGYQVSDLYHQIVTRVAAFKSALIAQARVGLATISELELAGKNVAKMVLNLDQRLANLETKSSTNLIGTTGAQLVGKATLPAATTTHFVNDHRVTAHSKVFLTPSVATTQYLAVTDIKPGSGFTVAVTNRGQSIPFNYWLVK